jgi:hypothetical protein
LRQAGLFADGGTASARDAGADRSLAIARLQRRA